MEFEGLLDKISNQYQSQFPFVVYSLPNEDSLLGRFQKNNDTHVTTDFTEDGFVFAPFSQEQILLIPSEYSEQISIHWTSSEVNNVEIEFSANEQEKTAYTTMVGNALEKIKTNSIPKIVTSRKAELTLDTLDLALLVRRLFSLYPSAFRYIWYHPVSGLWVGATPEVLLKVKHKEFSTMALAGTQTHVPGKEPKWSTKEILEQQWVTDDIAEKLQKVTSIVKVSKTKNHVAGSLVHLRTDFNGVFTKSGRNLGATIRNLHPTPAVCGVPRNIAHDFIQRVEGYDREYYTGYLGPVTKALKTIEFFVNLRCMKIVDQKALLFVGGGITADSVPNKEWEETQNKLQTMLQVIGPMLSH